MLTEKSLVQLSLLHKTSFWTYEQTVRLLFRNEARRQFELVDDLLKYARKRNSSTQEIVNASNCQCIHTYVIGAL